MLELLYETWNLGGPVLIPIFVVGFLGFFLVLRTYAELGSGLWRVNLTDRFEAIRESAAEGRIDVALQLTDKLPSLVRYGVRLAIENRSLSGSALRHILDEKLDYSLFHIERYLPLIRSLAASAPLLGLLGTVSGLIHTFRTMTEYGSGNSQLLAAGIAEALIATQTGLLIAIVLILLGQRLEGRVQWLQQQVEYGLTLLLHLFEKESSGFRPAHGGMPGGPSGHDRHPLSPDARND
jgi:biopolymer transport protein ExbB